MSLLDKYHPLTFEDYIFPDDFSEKQTRRWIDTKSSQPLLLYGCYGTGKSSLAHILTQNIYGKAPAADVQVITSTGQKDVAEFFRKLENFCYNMPITNIPKRFVIIDEVDLLCKDKQKGLKSRLTGLSKGCHFIFTTNEMDHVDGGIKSRALCIAVGHANPERWLHRMKHILTQENAPIPADDLLLDLASLARGDCRNIIKNLERYIAEAPSTKPPAPPTKPKFKVHSTTQV